MTEATKSELLKLIRNEIDLGLTFMDTYRLASSADHSSQALSSAQAALRTAKAFLEKMTEAEAHTFQPDLQKLENVIAACTSKLDSAENPSTQL